MRIDAIVLGCLTVLLGISLSASAQAPLHLPDLSEPATEKPATPDAESPANRTKPAAPQDAIETDENDANPVEAEEGADHESAEPEADSAEDENSEDEDAIDAALPPLPDNCEPLPLVNGEGSEVTRRTSPPSFTIPIPLPGPIPDPHVRSNWNTDWYIPNAQAFDRYRVVLMPRSNGRYSIQMYFKYPDDTADQFYEDQEIRLTANDPLIIEAQPRSDLPPYQINANIGGILSIGVRYTIVVAGCRGE